MGLQLTIFILIDSLDQKLNYYKPYLLHCLEKTATASSFLQYLFRAYNNVLLT